MMGRQALRITPRRGRRRVGKLADLAPMDLQKPRGNEAIGRADLDVDLVVARDALGRERAIDPEQRRRRGIERHQAEVGDLEARRRKLGGVEALYLLERGAGAKLERMKSGWRARRDKLARLHHPG